MGCQRGVIWKESAKPAISNGEVGGVEEQAMDHLTVHTKPR